MIYPIDPPTGAMDCNSPFYIAREADAIALERITGHGITLSITGSRQVGKSSLLARLEATATTLEKQVVVLDFQGWEKDALGDTNLFYQRLCAQLSANLRLGNRVEACWAKYGGTGSSYCCSRYVQDYLLAQVTQEGATGLVIALDEVETLIDAPFRSQFFGLLRSWHNARATKAHLKALDLVLVSSTEPYQLIEDLNQSPFNVGTMLKLEDFSPTEVAQLNQAYGNPLQGDELKELYRRVGGHPYLTAQVLAQVAGGQVSRMQVWQTAHQEQGVLGSHLVYHRMRLGKRPGLLEGMGLVAQGKGKQVPKEVALRLEMAGLVKTQGDTVVPRCGIYQLYFRDLAVKPPGNDPEPFPEHSRSGNPSGSRGSNPWISGSFYLFVGVVMISLIAGLSKVVNLAVLPVVVISGLLLVMVIGAFQLKQDDRFSESGFLTLMQETLKRLPLIRKAFSPPADEDS